MNAKDDFKFIHIGWSDKICCDVQQGKVINRNNKITYNYCYKCNKRKKENQDG